MTLVKYNNRGNTLDNLFNDLLDNSFFRPFTDKGEHGNSVPSSNIIESEKEYLIELAIPGFNKTDIVLDLNENVLSISSQKKEEKSVNNFKMREFNYQSFSRSFKLPKEIDANKISAAYVNGILTVTVPKLHKDENVVKKTIKIS